MTTCIRYFDQNVDAFLISLTPDIQVIKMVVVWVVTPCGLVEVYRRFRGAYCLHHHGDLTDVSEVLAASIIRAISSPRLHGATTQKTAHFHFHRREDLKSHLQVIFLCNTETK
jgi:hypothetical protein